MTTYRLPTNQFRFVLGMLGTWWRLGDSVLTAPEALRVALLAAEIARPT